MLMRRFSEIGSSSRFSPTNGGNVKLLPEERLLEFLRQQLPDAKRLPIEHLAPFLGGLMAT